MSNWHICLKRLANCNELEELICDRNDDVQLLTHVSAMMTSSCTHNFPGLSHNSAHNSDSNTSLLSDPNVKLLIGTSGIGGFADADGLEGARCPRANPRIFDSGYVNRSFQRRHGGR